MFDDRFSFDDLSSRLDDHLLESRTIVVSEAITSATARALTQRLAVLASESSAPVRILVSSADGGDTVASLSVHDLVRSLDTPVTVVIGGRVSGAGLLACLAPPSSRRYALPHACLRLEASRVSVSEGTAADLKSRAEEALEERRRAIDVLAERTGQDEAQIRCDLDARRAFDAEEAVAYGLIGEVVNSRRALDEL